MAKKEDDLDVLLPNWAGAAAHGFTISGSDDGIFIKDVVESSPVGKSGVMKEGDQIVSATIYFDEMGYEEAQKILQTVDRHTVGLKLHRKGERLSPGGSYSWDPDRFGATSPDAVLSGDDEDYQRIFRKKIKPHLKSEDGTEASDQDDKSSSVHITRKVITRTVHVTNPTMMTDVDIHSPEFKIKVPRHEQVSIEGSGPKLESSEMDVDVTGTEGLKFQMGDGQRTTHTMHIVKTKVVEVTGPDTEHGQTTFHMPQINLAGGTVQTSNLDVKFANTDMGRSAPNVDVSLPKTSIDFSDPTVTTGMQDSDGNINMHSIKMPACTISEMYIENKFPEGDIKATGTKIKGNVEMHDTDLASGKIGKPHFKISGVNVSKSKYHISDPDLEIKHTKVTEDLDAPKITFEHDIKVPNVNIKGTKVDIETTAMKQSGLKFEAPSIHLPKQQAPDFDLSLKGPKVKGEYDIKIPANTEVTIKGPNVDVPDAKIEGGSTMFNLPKFRTHKFQTSGLKLEGQDLNIDANLPEVDVNLKGPTLKGEVQMPNVDIEGAGKIKGAKFGMPGFSVLAPKKTGMYDYNLDLKGPNAEGDIAVPDVNLKGDIKGPKVNVKGPKVQIEETDVKGSGAQFSMPHMNLSKIQAPEIDLNFRGPKLKGDHGIGAPSGKVKEELKGPQVDVDVDESGAGGIKFGLPKHKLPKFHMDGSKVEVPIVHMGGNVRGTDVKLSAPKLEGDVKIRDVDVEGAGKIKGSKLKGGYDVNLASGKVGGEIKTPKVDVGMDVPGGDIEGVSGNISMPKFKMPKFQMSGSKVQCSDLDFDANIPGGDIKLSGPKLEGDVEMPTVNVEGAGKIVDPKFRMPKINLSAPTREMPDVNLDHKGTKIGEIKVPDVKFEGDIKGPNLDIKGPKVNIETPDVKGRGVKFSLPSTHLSKIEAPDINLNSRGSKLKGVFDVDVPSGKMEGEMKEPKVDIDMDVPEGDVEGVSGRFSMPKFKVPQFRMSGTKVEGPDIDFSLRGPKLKGDYDVDMPSGKVEGEIKGPKVDVDVDVPRVDVEGDGARFSLPKFNLPKFHMGGSKGGPDVGVDMNLPDADVKLSGPKVEGDVKMPDVDVDGVGKGPTFKMPGFNVSAPKIQMPDFKVDLRGPNDGGNYDIDMPSGKVEGEIKGPKVDVDVPGGDVEGGGGGFGMPKFKIPKFRMGGSKVEGPDMDIDANIPSGDIKLSGPKLEGDVEMPDVDVDVEGAGKIKGSKFRMPGFNISTPKIGKSDFNLALKGPKVGGDVDVPDISLEGDIKGPNVDIKGPKVDIEAPDVKGSAGKFSLPSIHLHKIHAPDLDLDFKGTKLKGDYDVDMPSGKVEGEIKGPKVDVDVDVPRVDVEGDGGRFSLPKFKLPKFHMGGSKGGPDVGVDMNLPEADVKLSGPKVEGDVKMPDVDVGGVGKGPTFKMPGFNVSAPKIHMPDFKVDLRGPNVGGNYDIDMPSGKVEGEIKGPKVDVDVPGGDVEGGGGGFSMPKFKMPKFRMGGSKVEGPDMDIDANIPGGDIKLSGPKLEGDVEMPDVDVDVEGAGKIKGPKFRLPGFNISAPKIGMPDFDLDLKGPKVGGDVDVPDISLGGDIKGPKVDIKGPKVDIEAPDVKGSGGKISMPSIHLPKIQAPELDFSLRGPKLKGDYDVDMPSGKVEGEIKVPKVDVDVPRVDVEGDGGRFSLPKFKLPKFHMGGSKGGPDVGVDMNLPEADVKLSGPKVEGDVKMPDVDVEGVGKGPTFKMPGFNVSAPKMHMPDFKVDLGGPKVGGKYDIDVPSGKVEGEIKGPKVDVDVPGGDVEGGGGGFSMPKFKMPKFRMGGSKVEGPDMDIDANIPSGDIKLSGPKLEGDVEMPDVDVDVEGAGKIKGPKFRLPGFNISAPKIGMPDFDLDLKGPKVRGDVDVPDISLGGDIKGPKVDIKGPKVDIEAPDVKGSGGKISMPSIHLPKIQAPELDFSLRGPKLKGDYDVDMPSGKVEGEIKGPKVDVDVPRVDVEGDGGRFSLPKFKLPKFHMGGSKGGPDVGVDMNLPEADVKLSGPKVEGDVKMPDVDVEGVGKGPTFKMPGFNVSAPKMHMPDFKVDLGGPKVGGKYDIDVPSGKVEGEIKGPKVDVDVPGGDVEGGGGGFSMPKFKMPKFRMGGSKVEGPDMDIDANIPSGDIKLSGPKLEGDVEMPDVDVDVEGAGKIKGPKFRLPGFNISAPKIGMPDFDLDLKGPKVRGDVDVPDISLGGDIKGPKVDIKGPKVDIEAPDVKGSGGKISMPSIHLPKIQAPELDFSLRGPKLKGDYDVDMPSGKVEGEIKGPKVDVDVPRVDVEGDGGRFSLPKFKLPKFHMGGSKGGPDVGVDMNLPEADVKLSGPKVEGDVKMPDVDVEGVGKGPTFKMPGFNVSAPKMHMPDFKVDLGGPKVGGKYDIDVPSGKVEGEIKGPKVDVDVPGGDVEGGGGGFSMPKFKMPKFRMGGSKVEGPDMDIDANIPSGDIKLSGPKLEGDVEMPDVDVDVEGAGKIKGPKFRLPGFNISAPKIGMPDFDLDLKGPKVRGDVDVPDISLGGDIKGPKVDIKGPKVDIEAPDVKGSGGKISMPSIHLPKIQAPELDFSLRGPKLKGDYDVDMPSGKVEGEIKGPKVDVDVPRVDVEGDGGRFSLPKFKLPKFHMGGSKGGPDVGVGMNLPEADVKLSGPKVEGDVKMPDVDVEGVGKGPTFKIPGFNVSAPKMHMPDFKVDLGGPKVGGKYDIDVPSGKVEGEIKGPKVDVDVPGGDVEGGGGGFSMPKFKMPKFRMGGSKVEGPDMDIDANIPSGDIKLSGPKLEGDVEMPDVDVDVEGAGKIKGPKFRLPGFNISAPKIGMPDFDLDLKGPKVRGDVDVPDISLGGDIKGPKVDIEGPKVDIEAPDVKGSGGKISMPSIHLPKIQAPELDFSLRGPKLKGDYDVDMPSGKVEGEIKGPKVDVDVPRVDVEGDGGRFSLPKFKLPKFHMGGSKGGPDVGVDMNLPEADVKLSGPKVEGDVKMPDVDVEGVGKGPTFKMPGFNVSAPKMHMPDFKVDLGGPKVGGKYDIDVPSGKVEGEIKGPKVDVDVPGGDVEGGGGGFSMPKFKMPKFRMGGSKVEGPDMDIDANIPSGDIKLSGPKLEGDVEMPDVDVDVEGAGKIKGPKFRLPGFNISAPKIGMPDFDLDLKGPKVRGDVDVPDISLGGDIKGPKVDIKGPKVDIEAPDVKGSGGKISMPSIHLPKIQAPELDFSLRGPKLKGDYDVDMPSGKVEGEIKGPKVDVDVPRVDVEGDGGRFSLPKFKLPKFHMGGSKGGPDVGVDMNLPEADVKLSGPKVEGDVKMPDVDVEGVGKGPTFKMPGFNVSAPKMHMPDFKVDLGGPKVGGKYDIDVPSGKVEGEIKGPKVDVDVPGGDVEGGGGGFSMPKFKMPKFRMGGSKVEGPDMDIDANIPSGDIKLSGPKLEGDVEMPDVDVDVEGAGKIKGPKFRLPGFNISAPKIGMPDFDLDLKGPKVRGDVDVPDISLGGDIKGPKVDIKGPKVDIEAPDVKGSGGKISMPSIHLPKIQAPELDFSLRGPKLKGDYDVDMPSGKVEGEIKGPKVDVDVPRVDVEGDGGRFSLPKFKLPKFHMGGSKGGPDVGVDMNLPEADVKLSGPKVEGDVKMPDVDVDVEGAGKGPTFKMPGFDVSAPKIQIPDFKVDLRGPKVGGKYDIDVPSGKVEGEIKGPKVDVDVPGGDVEGGGGGFSMPKFKMPKFRMGGSKVVGPDMDIDANIPSGDIKLSGPKLEGDVEMPDVDVDVEGAGKIKGPKFRLPGFNISAPKIGMPDFDLDLKGAKVGGDVDVPEVNLEGGIKGPNVDIEGPKVDFEAPDIKGSGGKISMPSIHLPKIQAPELDFSLRGPKVKGNYDVEVPSANIEGGIKAPQIVGDVSGVDADGGSAKFNFPKFKMPKFRIGGSKEAGPDVKLGANVPGTDVKLSGPKMEAKVGGDIDVPDISLGGGIKGPKVDIKGPKVDIEAPDIKGSGGKFSLPSINLPNLKSPDVDFSLKSPKVKGDYDINVPSGKVQGEIKGPKLDVNMPGADVEGGSAKFNFPKFKMPRFHVGGSKVKGRDIEIEGPKVDIEAPDIKGSGGKLSMPSKQLPKIHAPDVDFSLKSPKLKADYDVDMPSGKLEGEIKAPNVDVDMDVPDGDVGMGGKFSLPKFKMPKFHMGGPKIDVPDVDIDANIPEADVKLSGPKIQGGVEMPDVDLDIEGGSKIKGPKFHMPKFNISGPKMPDFNLDLRGPKLEGDVNIPDVNLEGDIKGPNVDIKGPRVDIETPDVKGGGGKFSLPSFHLPKFQAPDIDLNLKGRSLKGDYDVDMPSGKLEGEIKAPKVDIDADVPGGDVGMGGKFSLPKFKMPKLHMGGPKVDVPDVDIVANIPEADVKLSGPKIQGGVEMPDVDLDIEGGSKIKGPKFHMPKFNISGPKMPDFNLDLRGPKLEGDVNIPDVNLEGDIKGPNVDIKGPRVDIETPDVKGGGGKFSLPSFHLPKFQAPDIDLNLKGRSLKGDYDVDMPSGKLEGEIKAPKVDIDADVPGGDVGMGGKFSLPKFKMPKLHMGGPKVDVPDVDIDANIPEADVKLSGPKIQGGVEMPDVDLDIEGGSKIRGPKFHMPKFNISGPKMPDFNLDLRGPKLEGDVDIPDVNLEGDIKGPNVDIKGPRVDIETPDVKGGGGKFSLPSFHLPKFQAPDIDLNLKGRSLKGDYDVDMPSGKLEGEIKAPKVDIDADVPGGDVGMGGKFSLPKFKMPKLHMGGPKVDVPDVDIDANIPEADVKLSGPKIQGGVEMPDVDLDIEGGSKIRGPKFHMPKFNISGPKMPDFNLDLRGPKLEGDVDIPDVNLEGDIKGPNVDIKGPRVDIETPDVKGGGGKFSLPSFHLPKFQAPDIDLNLKGRSLKGDYDVDMPSGKLEGEIKAPKVDIDADVPGGDVGMGGKFSLPKFKMPKLHMGGPKVDVPDVDIDANIPEADVKLSGPKIQGGVEMPDVDLDIEGGSKIRGPKFHMPKFNISVPKMPDFNLDLRGPKLEGDVDIPDVNLEGDIKGPNVDIKGPRVDIETPDVKGGGGKFSLPSFHLPKFQAPDIDLNLKGRSLKGDYDVDMPSGKLEGEINAPNVNVDMDVPEGDLGMGGKFSLPKFKMPKFHMGGPKIDVPDVDIDANIPEADVKLSGPKIQGGVEMPDVDLDIEGGSKIKGPKFHLPKFNISGPKMPDFNLDLRGPKLEGDVNIPDVNLEGDIKGPNVDIKGPRVDIETPDVKGGGGKFSLPSFHLPKFQAPDIDLNLKGRSLKGDYDVDMPSGKLEGEINAPNVNVDMDVPEGDVGMGGKFSLPKFKMPKFHMGGPKVDVPDVDIDANIPEADVKLSGPKIQGGVEMPDVDLDIEGGSKIKGPKLQMPKFNISGRKLEMPDLNLGLKDPKMGGSFEGPDIKPMHLPKIHAPGIDLNFSGPKVKGDHEIDVPSGKMEGEIKGPKVDVDVPGIDAAGSTGKFSFPKFKFPKFRIGGPKVEGPDVDMNAKVPTADIKLSGPKMEGNVETPDVDVDVGGASKYKSPKFKIPGFNIGMPGFKVEGPDADFDTKLPEADIKLAGPKVESDVKIPDVDVEGSGKFKSPKFKVGGFNFSAPKIPDFDLEFKGPKMGGGVDVHNVNLEGDIKSPHVDIKGPNVEIEAPNLKGRGGKFSLPSLQASDIDLKFKGPKGDHEIDVPSGKIEGDIKAPKVDVDVSAIDAEGGSGKFSFPKLKMPKFHLGGSKMEGPDVDLDAHLPDADVKLSGPNVEGDVKIPDVDIDVGGAGKTKSPKFKMPGFKISTPKVEMPDFNLELKGPKVGGDVEGPHMDIDANLPEVGGKISGPKVAGVEIPDVNLDVEGGSKIKGPKLKMPELGISAPKIGKPDFNLELKGPILGGDIDAPDLNMEGDIKGPNFNMKPPKVDIKMPDVKASGPKISLPSVHLPHIKTPDFDLGFKGSKLQGGQDIDISSPNIGGEMKGPKIDIEAPDVDLEGTGGHFHMPKIKMPKFKMGGTKIEEPDVDIDASVPKANVKIDGVDVPEINLNADSKIKGSGFQMPGFNISLPKFKGPNVDVSLKGPELKGGAEVPDINMGGDIKGPEFEMKGPKVDIVGSEINIEGPDLKGDGHKFSTPALDIGLKDQHLKGTADIKSPGFGIDLNAPKIDVGGEGGAHLKMPKMKKPKFGFGVKGQGDLSAPSLDVTSPDVDVNVDSPDISVKTKGKKGKFKMPKLNIKSKKPGRDLKATVPKSDLDLSRPDVDIKSPDLNASLGSSDGQLNIKSSKLKKPRFGKVNLSFLDIEFDLASPKVKGELPNAKAKGDLQVPDINFSSDDMKGPHIDMRAPGINVNTDANLQGPGIKEKGSKLKFPSINIKSPKMADTDVDINLKGTNLKGEASGNIEGPTIGIKRPEIDFDVDAPNVDIEKPEGKLKMKMKKPNVTVSGPNVNLDTSGGAGGKLKMPKLKLPSFGVDSKAGEIDTNVAVNLPKAEFSGPKLKGDIDIPSTDTNISAPKLNLESPEIRFGGLEGKLNMPELNITDSKVQGSGLNFGGDLKTPGLGLTVDAPDMDINADGKIKGPKIDISAPDVSVDLKDPQLKGSINLPSPNIKGIFKEPLLDVKGPGIDVDGGDFNIKSGKVKMPQINIPKVDTDIAGLKVKSENFSGSGISASDFDVNVKGPTLGTKLSGPKMDVDIKSPKVEIEGPSMKLGGADINVGGLKEKFPSAAPKANIEFSGAKFEGGSLSAEVPVKGGIGVSSSKSGLYDPELDVKAPGISADIRTIELDVPLDKMKIPKFKPSQFKIKGPNLEETGMAVGGRVPEIAAHGPGINIKGPQASVNLPEGEMESTGVKVKKGKIKMPKFNFSKSKGKSSYEGLEGDFSASGPKIDIKGSKGSPGFGDIEVETSEISIAGKDPSLDIATSPKGKSRTLDFSLFKGKRSERHRSSSLSDEHELSPSSPKGKLEFEEGGAKGKKSKLKFGTFGGLGAKSKGSYEVNLNEGEAEVEGSGISLVSKKSRISSTSSSDSGSKSGLRFPKVELNINKKK
ncbi:neuroblast differentiation-associated protein AHNAK [Rhinoraja longicauda]